MEDLATERSPAPSTPARCPSDAAEMGIEVAARASPVPTGSVSATFEPVTVMLCGASDLQSRGAPKIRYTLNTKEALVNAPLPAAFRLPDQRFNDEDRGVCSLEFTPLPYLLLLDRQRQAIRVAMPVNACGRTRNEVDQALADLSLRETRHLVVEDIYLGR